MICNNCGKEINDASLYCSECGSRLDNNENPTTDVFSANTAENQPVNTYQQEPGYNGLAIAGFVVSFFFKILGLIFSAVALATIKKSNEKGNGLAIAGLVISIVGLAFWIIILFLAMAGILRFGYLF